MSVLSCKTTSSDLIDVAYAYVCTQSSCPTLRWHVLVHNKREKKFGHMSVTSAITHQSTNWMIAPIDQISS